MPNMWLLKEFDVTDFLDTNVIIRFLTRDNPVQSVKAQTFLKAVETGSTKVITSEAVIIEAVQVLSSKALYHLSRADIKKHLTNIIELKGLQLSHKRSYVRALDLYAQFTIDFVDALNIAYMERLKIATIISFDRDFEKIKNITRKEP